MAKVVDLNMHPDIEDLMLTSVKTKNRYYSNSIIDRKIAVTGRRYNKLVGQSYMKLVSLEWKGLTQSQRDDWSSAGDMCGFTGWQLFLQDLSFRIKTGIPGYPTPSLFHQYKSLIFQCWGDCREMYFDQIHEFPYYYLQKNVGQKNARTWTAVEETITAPLKVEFNYFSNMSYVDTPDFYHLLVLFSGYKDDVWEDISYYRDLDLVTDWKSFSETFNPDLDEIVEYTIVFAGYPVQGILMIDNCNFEHDAANFAWDPTMKNITQKYWSRYGYPNVLPHGAWWLDPSGTNYIFGSYYVD